MSAEDRRARRSGNVETNTSVNALLASGTVGAENNNRKRSRRIESQDERRTDHKRNTHVTQCIVHMPKGSSGRFQAHGKQGRPLWRPGADASPRGDFCGIVDTTHRLVVSRLSWQRKQGTRGPDKPHSRSCPLLT